MDYTFHNSIGKQIQVELNEYELVIRENEKEQLIPYSAITDVRLERKKNSYIADIQSMDFGSVQIYHHNEGTQEDQVQSRLYNTFIRILHFHLIKNRCHVEFYSGFKPSRIVEKFIFIVLLSAFAYLTEDYFSIIPLQPHIFGLLILGCGSLLLTGPYLINRPKTYNPSDIPLNMLPPVT